MKYRYFCAAIAVFFLFIAPSVSLNAADKTPAASGSKWREYFGLEKTEKREKISDSESETVGSILDLVDVPTSDVLEYGQFRLNFLLYSKGGVQNHIAFGVFRRLNIGTTWDIDQLLGSEEVKTVPPSLMVKFRVYDGGNILPSLAIGYDGQGRFFNRTLNDYFEHERGLYAVLSKELYFSDFLMHAGANISRFRDGNAFGFFGFSYKIENKVAIFTEYDNIHKGPENRWNAGVRFLPTPSLAVDFAFRRIASKYDKERVLRINWVAAF